MSTGSMASWTASKMRRREQWLRWVQTNKKKHGSSNSKCRNLFLSVTPLVIRQRCALRMARNVDPDMCFRIVTSNLLLLCLSLRSSIFNSQHHASPNRHCLSIDPTKINIMQQLVRGQGLRRPQLFKSPPFRQPHFSSGQAPTIKLL